MLGRVTDIVNALEVKVSYRAKAPAIDSSHPPRTVSLPLRIEPLFALHHDLLL